MFASTIRSFIHFGFWGGMARVLLILLCAGIVLLIAWRRKNNMFCKTCKKRVGKFDTQCKNCGAAMTEDNTEMIIGISSKTRVISVLSIAVLVGTLGISIVAYASNHTSYGTGMYSDFRQTYTQNDRIWGIQCESALTGGSFNKTIAVVGNSPAALTIESSCDSGTLILKVKQGDRVESIDISNTNGEIQYDLTSFDDKSDIKLSVEHSTAKNVGFKIFWE